MFRIDDPTASGSLPTPETAGTEGYFTEGNPGSNIPPTNLRASWLNMIQQELRNIVVAAGLTPSKTTYNQVLQAIQSSGVAYGHGQCRLVKSGANIVLQPCGGNKLAIAGAACVIPAAGVTLAPTGLSSSTTYFIYAYMNAGTMTLAASTTGHVTDTSTGVEVMSGDNTRTLVGMVRVIAGPAFADSATQRFVISYFNRRSLPLVQASVSVTGINTTDTERTTANRCEFLTWGDDAAEATVYGHVYDTAATGGQVLLAVGFDGTKYGQDITANINTINYLVPASAGMPATLAEGYHYSSAHAHTNSSSTGAITVTNVAKIRG